MPNSTSLSELAAKFSAFHNTSVTKAQALMIDDGAPASIVLIPQAERDASWKGKKARPTQSMQFAQPKKDEDPATAKLRKEFEKAAETKKAKSLERLREYKSFQNRSAPKPELKPRADVPSIPRADAPSEQEIDDMATNARKKISTKKAAPKKAAPKASKKAATAKARTPIAAGERSRFDWAAAQEKATAGKVPSAPDFSAPTHARFLPIMGEIKEALKLAATDREAAAKALKAIKINPISSTPKAMDRYRKLCVTAMLSAPAKA